MARKRVEADTKKVVAYIRVSTDRQELGPEAQRAAVLLWARTQGATVVAWCEDRDVSGATSIDARPGFLAAMAAIREHGAGVLVAAKRDRIARDVVVAAAAGHAVRGLGATIRTADGSSDQDGPEGELLRGVVDVFASYERALIRSRTRAALQAKKVRGERVGTVPYGYQADGARLVAHVEEQATIALARALRDEGMSLATVGTELAALGHRNRKGRAFDAPAVCRMLRIGA